MGSEDDDAAGRRADDRGSRELSEEAEALVCIFPGINREWWRSRCAFLWSQRYGGSGLSIGAEDLLTLDWDEIESHIDRLQRLRAAEAAQLSSR